MKKVILLLSLVALAACSSKPKEEDMQKVEEAPAVEETAPAPAPTTSTMDSSSTDESGMSMSGDFPDVEGTERSGTTCTNGSDSRMVSVIDTPEGPCGVVYTKFGNKKTVAYAKHEMAFCDRVFENVKGNLSGAGFSCTGGAAAPAPKAEEAAPAKEEPAAAEPQAEEGGEAQEGLSLIHI